MCVSTVQPKITFLENQTASELEEQITLTCEATGDPTPNIIWSFGRRVFTENEQVLRLRDQGSVGKRLGTRGLHLEYASWNNITVEICIHLTIISIMVLSGYFSLFTIREEMRKSLI